MTGALALLAGVLAGLAAAQLPGEGWLWSAGSMAFGVLLTPLRTQPWPRRLAVLLVGLLLACVTTQRWQRLRVVSAHPDSRMLLEGEIVTVPARDGTDFGFDAEVNIVDGSRRDGPGAGDAPRRARLRWRTNSPPRVGERWRLLARLAPAADTRNFSGVDVERLAFRDRIHLHARVLPSALNQRLALATVSIDTLRARIARRIHERVADPDAAGLIVALAVGLTDGMSTDQWRVFNATGTTHLVAISGMHVTLFALLAFTGARWLWRLLPTGRVLEREPFALLSGVIAAGGYALLSGFSVPAQRTWLMLGIFALARLVARRPGAARTWAMALVAVLLLDPLAPLAAGFWLSFAAVGVILVIETTALVPAPRAQKFFGLQAGVMLALAPLTFAVFGSVSLSGLVVNFAAIPVISFLFVPLVLAGAMAAAWLPALDGVFFGAAATLYDWLWPGLAWAADLDYSTWRCEPPPWWFVVALPAALLLLRRFPLGLRLGAAAMVLPLVLAPSRLPESGAAQLQVIDSGRGTAVLVATRAHTLLFDTGDSWNSHGTSLARAVLPALDALGIRRVDLLVLPRLDADRAAGAALLAFERGVDRILVGGGWPATVLPAHRCDDTRFDWDGIGVQAFVSGRGGACVVRITAGGRALLLAGDLDADAEREMLARRSSVRALAGDVVVISRQAGSIGSTPEWIEACDAGLAIATGGIAGSDSRERALQRWRRSGVRVMDTRTLGAIQFVFGTRGVTALAAARSSRYPFAWRR